MNGSHQTGNKVRVECRDRPVAQARRGALLCAASPCGMPVPQQDADLSNPAACGGARMVPSPPAAAADAAALRRPRPRARGTTVTSTAGAKADCSELSAAMRGSGTCGSLTRRRSRSVSAMAMSTRALASMSESPELDPTPFVVSWCYGVESEPQPPKDSTRSPKAGPASLEVTDSWSSGFEASPDSNPDPRIPSSKDAEAEGSRFRRQA